MMIYHEEEMIDENEDSNVKLIHANNWKNTVKGCFVVGGIKARVKNILKRVVDKMLRKETFLPKPVYFHSTDIFRVVDDDSENEDSEN